MSSTRSNVTLIAFGLSLAYLAAYQQFKLPPVLPVLLDSYRYDRTLAGALMSVYAIAGLILSVALGRALSWRGLAGPIWAGLALMILGNLLFLAAPATQIMVLAARALEGVGFAVLAIAGPVLANANASARHLPVVVGLTASWIPAGQLAATALAPAAFAWTGWQLLWFVAIAASFALAFWTWVLGRRGALALPISCGPAPVSVETASRHIDLRQRRCLALAAAVFTLWSCQYFAYMTWLPQFLVEAHGLPPSLAVVGYVVPVAVLILTNLAVGMILRTGVPLGPVLLVGLVSQAAVWWSIPLIGGSTAGAISLVVYGIGAGICPTCLFAMPSVIFGPGGAAVRAFGVIMTGRNLGVLVGPVLLAQAFTLSGGWGISAPIFGTVTTLAAALGLWLALWLGGSGYGAKR